jgi:hypothetical protein
LRAAKNPSIPEQEIFYNSTARAHILNNRLWSEHQLAIWASQYGGNPPNERSIPEFPKDSIIVKAAWRIVTSNYGRTVGVWKRRWPPIEELDSEENWDSKDRKVIELSERPCKDRLPRDEQVPLSCFYHVRFKSEGLKLLPKFLPDSSQPEKAYAILLGLNVMTKEMRDWTWSTFWWNPNAIQPNQPGAEQRPATIGPPWNRYLMSTSLSAETPPEKDDPCYDFERRMERLACRKPVIFNPYLGARIPSGTISNCMACHQRSAYGQNPDKIIPALVWRGELSNLDEYYADKLRLDYIWSLSNNVLGRGVLFLDQ